MLAKSASFWCSFSFLLSLSSCDRGKAPESDSEHMLYMMGQWHADNLAYLKLNERELNTFIKGLKDQTLKKKSDIGLNYKDFAPNLERYSQLRIAKAAEEEKIQAKSLSEALLKSGGKSLSSGLVYKILSLGNEKRAKENATVEIHLHQTLRTKDLVYSTLDKGKKEIFKVRDLIPGIQTALELIGEGGEVNLVIPSDLAYGDQGLAPTIPGGASISTYVKLFRIIP